MLGRIRQNQVPGVQKLNEAMDKMNALGAWELETRAKDVLALLDIPDPNMKIKAMSGGQVCPVQSLRAAEMAVPTGSEAFNDSP